MFASIGRVYVNERARRDLGWRPRHDFATIVQRLAQGGGLASALARKIGSKRYHPEEFAEGPYPVD
jgi:UDP-glucose 4-epimerase